MAKSSDAFGGERKGQDEAYRLNMLKDIDNFSKEVRIFFDNNINIKNKIGNDKNGIEIIELLNQRMSKIKSDVQEFTKRSKEIKNRTDLKEVEDLYMKLLEIRTEIEQINKEVFKQYKKYSEAMFLQGIKTSFPKQAGDFNNFREKLNNYEEQVKLELVRAYDKARGSDDRELINNIRALRNDFNSEFDENFNTKVLIWYLRNEPDNFAVVMENTFNRFQAKYKPLIDKLVPDYVNIHEEEKQLEETKQLSETQETNQFTPGFAKQKEPPVKVEIKGIESLAEYRQKSVQDVIAVAEMVKLPENVLGKVALARVGLDFANEEFVQKLVKTINTAPAGKYEVQLEDQFTGQKSTIANSYDENSKRAQTVVMNPTKHALVTTMLLRKSMAPPMQLDSEDPETALEVYEAAKFSGISEAGLDHLLNSAVKEKLKAAPYQKTFEHLQKLNINQIVQLAIAYPNRELGKEIPEEWMDRVFQSGKKREGPGLS